MWIVIAKRLIKISITERVPSIPILRNLVVTYTQPILLVSEIVWLVLQEFLILLERYNMNTKEG